MPEQIQFPDLQGDVDIVSFDPTLDRNEELINRIVSLSTKESMIPVTKDTIQRHHLGHIALLRTNEDTIFAGYGAITHVYSSAAVEFGALLVDPAFRGHGIASRILAKVHEAATEAWPQAEIFAFSNPTSRSIFEKNGGLPITNPDAMPPEVWKVCEACVNYQECVVELGKRCCGRIFDITEVEIDD